MLAESDYIAVAAPLIRGTEGMLAGNPDLAKGEFLETFLKHRAVLEDRASAIFDRGLLDGNSVIIRHENV